MATMRPEIQATTHAVSTGHNYSTQAAFQILEDGGNAIDAGVCAGIALGILQSDLVSIGGVAPIILYSAEHQEVVTIAGLGVVAAAGQRRVLSPRIRRRHPTWSHAHRYPRRTGCLDHRAGTLWHALVWRRRGRGHSLRA